MTTLLTNSFNLPPEYAPYVYLIIGVITLCFGIASLKKANRLSKHGIRTRGVLVRIIPKPTFSVSLGSESSHRHRDNKAEGIYRFTDEQGCTHEIKGSANDWDIIGSTSTTVLYNPQNPDDAITTDSGIPQLTPLIITLVGTGITAYAIFQLPL